VSTSKTVRAEPVEAGAVFHHNTSFVCVNWVFEKKGKVEAIKKQRGP
jgi:hypothetical protein